MSIGAFTELDEKEMVCVDGSWDGMMWLQGCVEVVTGGVGVAASLIGYVTNPASATFSKMVLSGSVAIYFDGMKNIYNSF